MNAPALIEQYFDLAPRPDADAYCAQFAEDAVVTDEGHVHVGLDAIRAWRSAVPPVHYSVLGLTVDDSTHVALAEISGDFPGSPVELAFRFGFADDGHIASLVIAT